jgi:phosphoenolpyruvate phosphomutase
MFVDKTPPPQKKPTVYVGMSVDVLHHGHINIIQKASNYGRVIVGLISDNALASFKRLPYLNWNQRKIIIENIIGVSEVVEQLEWDYSPNIYKYRPDFMIHGDDWRVGPLAKIRENTIKALASYGGELIEIPYTVGVNSQKILNNLLANGISPDARKSTLKRLLRAKGLSRFLETHSPISALIAENCVVEVKGQVKQFDGFWSSSLTDALEMGKPDIEALDISSRLSKINSIFDVTSKPLIMDIDTGGKLEHLEINIKSIERLGVSAVIMEDKKGLKRNSLLGNDVYQIQEEKEIFCEKISAGKSKILNEDFMIIARIESLILEKGMSDALERAEAYVDAGADGIMIHSRKREPNEVLEFASFFKNKFQYVPLVCIPTTYNTIYENDLESSGVNIVIYANHLLRAAFPAMKEVAESILINGRSHEIEEKLLNINDALKIIPGTDT